MAPFSAHWQSPQAVSARPFVGHPLQTVKPPKLLVRKAVLRYIRKETKQFPLTETSWALFGYLLPNGSIYLAGYIPPLAGCIVRRVAETVLGGKRLNDAVDWLWAHSAKLNPNSDAEFVELYKGHSHHQIGLLEFSQQDETSIVEYVRDNPSIKVAVGTLSVIHPPPPGGQNRGFTVSTRYYYYSRELFDAGVKEPLSINEIEAVEDVPGIIVPDLGWQFLEEQSYLRQLQQLRAFGYQVQVVENDPPTVHWFVRKPGLWNKGYIVLHIPLGFPVVPAEVDVLSRALRPDGRLHEIVPPGDFFTFISYLDREVLTHAAPSGTGAS